MPIMPHSIEKYIGFQNICFLLWLNAYFSHTIWVFFTPTGQNPTVTLKCPRLYQFAPIFANFSCGVCLQNPLWPVLLWLAGFFSNSLIPVLWIMRGIQINKIKRIDYLIWPKPTFFSYMPPSPYIAAGSQDVVSMMTAGLTHKHTHTKI